MPKITHTIQLHRASCQLSVVSCQFFRASSARNGQSLILLAVLMGGMLLMATGIAGLLTFYQVQQSGDTGRSMMAIFAADAGIERAAHFYYNATPTEIQACQPECDFSTVSDLGSNNILPNNAFYEVRISVSQGSETGGTAAALLYANGFDAGERAIRSAKRTIGSGEGPSP